MKKTLILLGVVSVAIIAIAATPTYVTLSGGGTSSAGASVTFPADPTTQIRLVNVSWNSDKSDGALTYKTGQGAYVLTAANASSSGVTQVVNTVTGLAANDVLVLQQGGSCYTASIASTNSGTNVVLASGGFGVATVAGSDVYKMSSATTVPVGATTNSANGEAIFVGNSGRPVSVALPAATTTNHLQVTARYE